MVPVSFTLVFEKFRKAFTFVYKSIMIASPIFILFIFFLFFYLRKMLFCQYLLLGLARVLLSLFLIVYGKISKVGVLKVIFCFLNELVFFWLEVSYWKVYLLKANIRENVILTTFTILTYFLNTQTDQILSLYK